MRSVFAFAVAVAMVSGCKKTSVATAPVVATVNAAGSWSGCFSGGSCSLSMTLADSAETDSTGALKGAGSWVTPVTVKGTRTDSAVTLHATDTGQTLGWSFLGVLAGNSLTGHMTGPSIDSTAQVTFTRSP